MYSQHFNLFKSIDFNINNQGRKRCQGGAKEFCNSDLTGFEIISLNYYFFHDMLHMLRKLHIFNFYKKRLFISGERYSYYS